MSRSPEERLEEFGVEVSVSTSNAGEVPRDRLRVFDAFDFRHMAIQPRELLLDPILRSSGLAMLSAFRGIGKTHVAMGIAHAVASGGKFLRWQAERPRPVLYVDGEMPGADLQHRVRMYPATAPGMFRLLPMDMQGIGVHLNLADGASQQRVESNLGNAELLILDNRSTLVSGGRENEAESWDKMQGWLLRLRRMGVSVLLIEHEGRSGNPRGTSKREDVLDLLIQLKRPADYHASQGARFEVHFSKARGVFGNDANPFEARLDTRDGLAQWSMSDLADDPLADTISALTSAGKSVRDIADETGLSKSKVQRMQARLRQNGTIR